MNKDHYFFLEVTYMEKLTFKRQIIKFGGKGNLCER